MYTSVENGLSPNDKLPMCSCLRSKVVYLCEQETCTSHNSQPIYCAHCAQASEGRHIHATKLIIEGTESLVKEWRALNTRIHELVRKAATLKAT